MSALTNDLYQAEQRMEKIRQLHEQATEQLSNCQVQIFYTANLIDAYASKTHPTIHEFHYLTHTLEPKLAFLQEKQCFLASAQTLLVTAHQENTSIIARDQRLCNFMSEESNGGDISRSLSSISFNSN